MLLPRHAVANEGSMNLSIPQNFDNHCGTLKSYGTAVARVKRVGKYIDTFGGTYESNLQTAQESLEDWADAHGNRKARGSSRIRAWVMAIRPA